MKVFVVFSILIIWLYLNIFLFSFFEMGLAKYCFCFSFLSTKLYFSDSLIFLSLVLYLFLLQHVEWLHATVVVGLHNLPCWQDVVQGLCVIVWNYTYLCTWMVKNIDQFLWIFLSHQNIPMILLKYVVTALKMISWY